MSKSALHKFAALLMLFCAVSLYAGMADVKLALAKFDNDLNVVEAEFWRGMTAAPASGSRELLTRRLERLQNSARNLENLLARNNVRGVQFTGGTTRLRQIPSGFRRPNSRNHAISFKKTTDAEYFKKVARKQRNSKDKKRQQKITDLIDYQDFLNEISDYNLRRITSRYTGNRELSASQQRLMISKGEEYLATLVSLRMSSARLKQIIK